MSAGTSGGGHACEWCGEPAVRTDYVVIPMVVSGKRIVQREITAAVCAHHAERFDAEKAEREEREANRRSEAAKKAARTRAQRRGLSVEEMTG
jgi:pyrimidine deaminase RibD-like protein